MINLPAERETREAVAPLSPCEGPIEGRGVYLGLWDAAPGHTVHVFVADDFLRDAEGRPLLLSFNEALIELARRNDGWTAGDGTEDALRREIIGGGAEFEGKLLLPPNGLLETSIYEALTAGMLPGLAEALRSATKPGQPDHQLWALSCTRHPKGRTLIRLFMLAGGSSARCYVDSYRTSVLPVWLKRAPAVA